MDLHTLYFSPTKNTKRIVAAIAKGIGLEATAHDITLPQNRHGSLTLGTDYCLVIGLPVYAGRIPAITEEFLHGVKGHKTPIILVTVFGNRGYDDTLLEMKDIFSSQGFVPIAAGAFIGEHSFTTQVATSRPDARDLQMAQSFGQEISKLLAADERDKLTVEVKGNRPYQERSSKLMGPSVDDNCDLCGICVANCPAAALSIADVLLVNEELCLRCNACVKSCPQEALVFDERMDPSKKRLIENCSERKEAELIYGEK